MQVGQKFVFACCIALSSTIAWADTVTINVDLDEPADGTYRLVGQSAFIQTRTDSITSGGQLDFIESGSHSITFDELFPPASLSDYLGFAYFGILETIDIFDEVTGQFLVIAYLPGHGVGEAVTDTFPYDAITLVNAFTSEFDSPEFLDMLGLVPSNSTTLGDIAVPPIGRPGTTLDLVAFFAGEAGPVGFKVGTLDVVVVPEPSSAMLMASAGVIAIALGRRAVARRRR